MSLWDVVKIGRGAFRVVKGIVLDEGDDVARGVKDLATGGIGLFTGAKAVEESDSDSDDSD